MNHKVFISYSDADKPFAGKIYAALECHGVRCWMSSRDLPRGADFQTGTAEAIAAAELVLLVFSSSANLSRKVIKELSLRGTTPLMAVRVEDVLPAGEFQQLVSGVEFDDLFEDFDARLELFCRRVKAVLQAEPVATPVVARAVGAKPARSKLPTPVWAALALAAIAVVGYQSWRAFGPGEHFWVPDTASSEPAAPAPAAPASPAIAAAPVAPVAPAAIDAVVTNTPVPSAGVGVPGPTEPPTARVQARPPRPRSDDGLASAGAPRMESTASHSPAGKPSFNCSYARTRAEHMICSDPDLAAADVELDRAYRAARRASPDKETLNEVQSEWRRSVRDTCPDVDCMMSAYEQRIDELY